MTYLFFILAAVLVLAAAAFIAHPFMRDGSRGARRLGYGLMIVAAAASLQLYLKLGYPALTPPMQQSEIPDMTGKELAAMKRLSDNPKDVDAMAALAAIRIARGADTGKTAALLEQAAALAPGDARIKKLQEIIAAPR